ncbi:MAG TPA: hypothetical protein VHN59_17380 [Chitinophagaceae bacterium]|nr:hypothetical protein [Chitinophagaceae bacterium]
MWTTILYILLAWFLYNLIFKFIIPVYRASRKMKQQFRQMHETMQEQMRQQQGGQSAQAQQPGSGSRPKPAGDYIDFEEIK